MTAQWRKKSLTWGKRIVLVVLILGGTVYGVLSMAARSKEPIRLGLQDYLQQASGHPAEVTDMTTVKLVPNIEFRMKGILIRDKENAGKTLLKADQAYAAVPLWHLFLGVRRYLGFEVQGLDVATGFFLPKKLSLRFFGISDPSGGVKAPQFLADGTYNGQPLLITAEMMRKERGKKPPLYYFDDSLRLTGKLGLLEGEGIYVRKLMGIQIDDARVVRDGDVAVFDVTDIDRDPAHALAEGTINDIPFKAELTPHLIKVTPGSEKPEDLKTLSRIVALVEQDLGIEGKPEILKFEIVAPETEMKE